MVVTLGRYEIAFLISRRAEAESLPPIQADRPWAGPGWWREEQALQRELDAVRMAALRLQALRL